MLSPSFSPSKPCAHPPSLPLPFLPPNQLHSEKCPCVCLCMAPKSLPLFPGPAFHGFSPKALQVTLFRLTSDPGNPNWHLVGTCIQVGVSLTGMHTAATAQEPLSASPLPKAPPGYLPPESWGHACFRTIRHSHLGSHISHLCLESLFFFSLSCYCR